MRYIITENRLNNLVSKYLEQLDWWEWDIGDGEFNLADGKFETSKILFRIQYSSIVAGHSFDVIYISDYLVTKLTILFSIASSEAIRIIIEWFNKRYNKSLTMENFEWMDDENQHQDD